MDEPGRRLPELHRIAVAHRAEQGVRCKILPDVSRLERDLRSGLVQHGVTFFAGGNPLGPGHHGPEIVLDLRLCIGGRLERIPIVRRGPFQGIGKPGEIPGQIVDIAFPTAEQEPRRCQEILVVVLLLDLGVGRVELVRRRREKQGRNRTAVMRLGLEQGMRKLCGFAPAVFPGLDQWLESLELVENDQVRLKGADAYLRQQPPQVADQPVPRPSGLVRPMGPVTMEPGIEGLAQLELQTVSASEFHVEVPPNSGLDPQPFVEALPPAFSPRHPALQQVLQGRGPLDMRSQEMKQHFPLPAPATGMPHLERRARREADEIQLVVHEAAPAVVRRKLGRQHGESGRQCEGAFAGASDLEFRQVSARDAGIAADIDDVDAVHVIPEMVDRPGDDAACDQRLAETDLVGDEEAGGAVGVQEQPPESMVDGAALEGLQGFHECRRRAVWS